MSEPQPLPTDTWYKNQLQEYAQRASMGLPVYKTIGEGPSHAPQFRSVVWIDGNCFTSPLTYLTRKVAEQEAAKFAFIGIRQKVKNEASSHVLGDTTFCKSIISEYAVKMNLGAPSYVTKETKAIVSIFVSTLYLNGVAYAGDAAKNKKEAEQLAARSAVKSILDSESNTTMSEIVRSKFKLYDALKNGKDSSIMNSVSKLASTNMSEDSGAHDKQKEANVTSQLAPIPESSSSGPIPAILGTSAHLALVLESVTSGPIQAKQVPHLQQANVIGGTVTGQLTPIPESSPSGPIPAIHGIPAQSVPVLESGTSGPIQAKQVPHLQQGNVIGGTVTAQLTPIPGPSPSGPIPAIQGTPVHSVPVLESGTSGPFQAKQVPHLQQVNVQAARQPFHEFTRQKPQTSSAEVELPILFVPATTAGQAVGCSAASRKRKRRKERKRAQLQSSLPMSGIPQNPPLEPSRAQ